MTFGLRILNDDGIVQIDEQYRNLVVISEGRVTTAVGGRGNAYGEVAFSSQSTCQPLIFVKPDSGVEVGDCQLSNGALSGGAWVIGPPWDHFAYECSGAFYYKVCGLDGTPAPSGTHGMVVYDDAGQVAYDSRLSYMQIKSVHRLFSQASPAYQDVTVPSAGEWFLLNNLRINVKFGETGPFRAFSGKYLSSTSLRIHCYGDSGTFADYGGGGGSFSTDQFDVDYSPLIVMTASF